MRDRLASAVYSTYTIHRILYTIHHAPSHRCAAKIEGGKIIKVEAHPIPEHMRPHRVRDRAALVGDAAGYVTKCSGEGEYVGACHVCVCDGKMDMLL